MTDALRALPAVAEVIDALGEQGDLVTAAARRAIDDARALVRSGEAAPPIEDIVRAARAYLEDQRRAGLREVINATGVMVHTNLGRAPLGKEQLAAVARVAGDYSNLEYDLDAGKRGSRYMHARGLVSTLTGAEDALVVNNNAAAVLLALTALCADREVIISRGELIEIGGEFRIPDVMTVSGARLVEVGTTNRTHLADYERAISPDTAAIFKVHPSNYRVVGFAKTVAARDLARLARGRGVTFIHDLGSGFIGAPEAAEWSAAEPVVADALAEGADLITFSGDKLLGGPQAGVIAGRADLIERLISHPLLRALRVDKMTLAALEATLRMYLEARSHELPLWKMAAATGEELEARARALTAELERTDAKVEAAPLASVAGGGSLPGTEIPSWGIVMTHPERTTAELERALRMLDPPVIARIEDDRLVLDLRTVPVERGGELADLLLAVLRP